MITKDTFREVKDQNAKLDILFDFLYDTRERVVKIEDRKQWDTAYAAIAGATTAIVVLITKVLFWKH